MYNVSRKDEKLSSHWHTALMFPKSGTIIIQADAEALQLSGCLGVQ